MTMLDDNRLSELLGRAAEAFKVPESGAAEILARADRPAQGGAGTDESKDGDFDEGAETPDELSRRRRLVAAALRHRTLSVAASLVVALVVAGTIGAVVRTQSNPTTTTSALHARTAPSPLTSTTVPALGKSVPNAPFATGAPAGSAGSTSAGTSTGTAASGVAAPANAPPLPSGAVGQSTKIEETGSLGLTVGKGAVARTMTRLSGLATLYGGFVANSQSQSAAGSGGAPYGNITLEVPVDNYSAVLKAAESFGKVADLSTKATDVTGQYVDLQARISALEASRQQYLTILSKATSIGDILSVQEQIDSIQSQIEQLQGQLQVLTNETSYSTVAIALNEKTPPPQPGPLPESGIVHAWHDSVGGFVAGVEGVVRLAGPFLFAVLCLALLAVGGRVLWRRYQRHRL